MLERGFEHRWETFHFPHNPLSESVDSLGARALSGPRILFNVTNVETGVGMVISSLGEDTSVSNNLLEYLPGRTLRMSTAMVASSRFPYVSPPGIIDLAPNQTPHSTLLKRSFVDGGYVDNTGTKTLAEIIEQVRLLYVIHPGVLPPIRIIPVFIRHVHEPGRDREIQLFGTDRVKFAGTNEIATPVNTILAVMNEATADALWPYTWGPKVYGNVEGTDVEHFIEVVTTDEYGAIPLGWSLSDESRSRIRKRLRISEAVKQPLGEIEWKDLFEPKLLSRSENVVYRCAGGLTPEDIFVVKHANDWDRRNPFTAAEPELNQVLDRIGRTLLVDREFHPIARNSASGSVIYGAWKALCKVRRIRNCEGAIIVQDKIADEYVRIRELLASVPSPDYLRVYVNKRIVALNAEMAPFKAFLSE